MKYPQKQFDKLVSGLRIIMEKYDITDNETAVNNLHSLYFKVFANKNYPDENKNVIFEGNYRLLERDENFVLYPDGCNDDHIQTAVKLAIKKVFSDYNPVNIDK